VHYVLDGLVRNNIPIETVDAGTIVEHQGNSLEFLHPRHQFVATTQNEASVVVLLRSPAGSVLLTGDLEGAGQSSMLRLQPIPNVTVLQAPHHGGAAANNSAFLAWTRPWLIVAQQDGRRATASGPNGTGWWNTHTHGAITVRPAGNSIIAESFLTGQRLVHISR
jgi:competence protein ComEC